MKNKKITVITDFCAEAKKGLGESDEHYTQN